MSRPLPQGQRPDGGGARCGIAEAWRAIAFPPTPSTAWAHAFCPTVARLAAAKGRPGQRAIPLLLPDAEAMSWSAPRFPIRLGAGQAFRRRLTLVLAPRPRARPGHGGGPGWRSRAHDLTWSGASAQEQATVPTGTVPRRGHCRPGPEARRARALIWTAAPPRQTRHRLSPDFKHVSPATLRGDSAGDLGHPPHAPSGRTEARAGRSIGKMIPCRQDL